MESTAKVTVLVVTDGRGEHLTRTMLSLTENVRYPFFHSLMVNDSGDPNYAVWLDRRFPTFTHIHHRTRNGFAAAVRSAFDHIPPSDYIFWVEDDMVIQRPLDIPAMASLLASNSRLAQVVLRRNPVNSDEIAAGGVVELHPTWYRDLTHNGHPYLEHNAFFSTNVNLMPYSISRREWPNEANSEGKFGAKLREDGYSFAYWGARRDAPWTQHIGVQRVGIGY